MSNRDLVVLGSFLFALLGGYLLYRGIKELVKGIRLLRSGHRVKATIIGKIVHDDYEGPHYAPVYEFIDHHQQKHVIESNISTSHPFWKIGHKVNLIYLEGQTEKARPINLIYFFGLPILIIIIGIILVLNMIDQWVPIF